MDNVLENDLRFQIENLTELLNSSNLTEYEDEFEYYYFYQTEQLTFLWVIFITIVAGNSAVLLALLLSKNRKSRMNFFIMHLAIADLSVGLINVLTDIIWRTTVAFYADNFTCKAVKYFQVLVTYSSTYVLVALSIDRYDAIAYPMHFSSGWHKARLLVGAAWGLSAVFSLPSVFLNSLEEVRGVPQCWIDLSPLQWRVYITAVAVSLFLVPALIISACYAVIVATIWTKSRIMGYPKVGGRAAAGADGSAAKGGRGSSGSDPESERKRASSRGIIPRAKIKTVKMTLVIVLVFILCWSPYFVYDLLQVYGYIPEGQTSIAVSTFIQSLAPLNSAANPLIYCLFSNNICGNLRPGPCDWLARKMCCCSRSRRLQLGPGRGTSGYASTLTSSVSADRTLTVRQPVSMYRSPRAHVAQNGGRHVLFQEASGVGNSGF